MAAVVIVTSALTAGITIAVTGGKFLSAETPIIAKKIEIKKEAIAMPQKWKEINEELIKEGVIDDAKFEMIYASRGGMSADMKSMMAGDTQGDAVINEDNASFALNLLWALGLANKNAILEQGPMVAKEYGGDAGKFASTGGWSLAKGDPMDHYSMHSFISLTSEQQELVERVAKGIYRPCCNNSVYFPDCNHGMAMLGFLELMASEGADEKELYRSALALNSFWFPDTYETIYSYLNLKGIDPESVEPEILLGKTFSSASGYRTILQQVSPPSSTGSGGGCSV